mgnify:CR=1 FL=1
MKYRELRGPFGKVYSRALAMGGQLSLTVALEATVLPTGYLRLSNFTARPSGNSEALTLLRDGIALVLSQTYVGEEMSGVVLRGENVFLRE